MKKLPFQIRESRFSLLLLLFAPALTFYLLEWFTHDPFKTMAPTPQILNLILFELIALLLFMVTGKLHAALMAETLFFALYGLVNYFVLDFRSVPIQPWDLFSIGTAVSVADNYEYVLDKEAICALTGFVLLLIAEFFCRFSLKKGSWRFRLPSAAILAASLAAFCLMFHSDQIVQQKLRLYDKLFTPTTISFKNGTALAFIMELRYISVEKPEGYNAKEAREELARWEEEAQNWGGQPSDEGASDAAVSGESAYDESAPLPNIIVIMNEAFSDPAVLGDFETNEDYMPFVHSLMDGAENTVSGWLNVSVLGGNTANTEFEFLTGHTMAFLPQGSIPYQQYIKGETPSLASHLAELGYATAAMHPYHASGWDRDTVYPSLGFEKSYFLPDYEDPLLIRKYVSDQSDYEKLMEVFEEKEEGKPLFLFNVTMQNHSSYTESFDNFQPDIAVEGSSSQALNNYLSLLKISDQALEELIHRLEAEEEDTVLVFFGDHQTTNSVMEPILKLNGTTHSALTEEEMSARYKVPFFIWANYDIEEQSGVETSPNYLGAQTLAAAGMPLSGYQSFLLDTAGKAPVVSANHVTLADGAFTTAEDQRALLGDYRRYQYYQIFDAGK